MEEEEREEVVVDVAEVGVADSTKNLQTQKKKLDIVYFCFKFNTVPQSTFILLSINLIPKIIVFCTIDDV